MSFSIKLLENEEIDEASALVWKTFYEFVSKCYTMSGIETFRNFIDPINLKMNSFDGFIEIFGAYDENGTLAGVIALRERTHICLCFVDKLFHKKGVGASLMKFVLPLAASSSITVNASDYGIPFYKKMGFNESGARTTQDGIIYTPMKKNL